MCFFNLIYQKIGFHVCLGDDTRQSMMAKRVDLLSVPSHVNIIKSTVI